MKHLLDCLKNPYVAQLFCIVGLIAGPLLVPFGINLGDEPYQIINAMDPLNVPFAPLTALSSGLYGGLVGYKLLYMRLLSVILVNTSILFTGLYSYKKTHRLVETLYAVGFAAIFTTTIKIYWYTLFGWDSFTVFFSVTSIIMMLRYMDKPTMPRLVVATIMVALTSLIKLPSAFIVIPMGLAIISVSSQTRAKRLSNLCLSAVLYIAIVLIGLIMIFGSLGQFITSLTVNSIGNHGISSIISDTIYLIALFIPAICTIIVVGLLLENIDGYVKYIVGLIVWLNLLIIFSYYFSYEALSLGVFVAIFVYLILANRHNHAVVWQLLVIFIACYTTAAGSNMGINKYNTWPVLPLVLSFASVSDFRKHTAFIIVILTTVLSFIAIKDSVATFKDLGIQKLKYTLLPEKLSEMRTTEDKAVQINEIYSEFSKEIADGNDFIIVGNDFDRFMYEYIFGWHNKYLRHDWDELDNFDDPGYVNYVEDLVKDQNAPKHILLINSKETANSPMQDMLNGYYRAAKETPRYTIYVRD